MIFFDIAQPMFWYRPIFMIELLIAEAFFAPRLKRRGNFTLRMTAGVLFCLIFAFAFPVVPSAAQTAWFSSVLFLSMFAASILALCFAYRSSFKDIIFCAIAGYTVQHVAQEAYELANVAFGLNGELTSGFYGSQAIALNGRSVFEMLFYVSIVIIFYTLMHMLFVKNEETQGDLLLKNSYIIIVSAVIVLIDVIISSVVTYLVPSGSSVLAVGITHLYNVVCCILVLFLLFEVPKRLKAENELEVVRSIHHREKQQYFLAKENIDLINMKYHDLKHQMRVIKHGGGEGLLSEVEEAIGVYDSTYQTENEALNVILTEKSLLCKKLSVKFSCIADGARLDFMSDTDIYSLFGNLLGNAIEAVEQLEPDERVISLSVRSHNSIVIVTVRNSYRGEIAFKDGLPVTSKGSKAYHGFGMKSVRYIVDKYKGEMKIKTDDQIFLVTLAFSR